MGCAKERNETARASGQATGQGNNRGEAVALSVEAVRRRVAEIASLSADDEVAHAKEDDLFADVLRAVAVGHPQSAELAGEALKSLHLDFSRYCS